jgi:hypothetical protein
MRSSRGMGIMAKSKIKALYNKGSGSKAGTLHPAPLKKIGPNPPSKALIKRK